MITEPSGAVKVVTALTLLSCPVSGGSTGWPVSASQRYTAPSLPAPASSTRPSGRPEVATEKIVWSGPPAAAGKSAPVTASHRLIPSSVADALRIAAGGCLGHGLFSIGRRVPAWPQGGMLFGSPLSVACTITRAGHLCLCRTVFARLILPPSR